LTACQHQENNTFGGHPPNPQPVARFIVTKIQ
jgi:hypothetical protein